MPAIGLMVEVIAVEETSSDLIYAKIMVGYHTSDIVNTFDMHILLRRIRLSLEPNGWGVLDITKVFDVGKNEIIFEEGTVDFSILNELKTPC